MGRRKLNADLPQRFSGKNKQSERLKGINLPCQSPAAWKNHAGQQALNSGPGLAANESESSWLLMRHRSEADMKVHVWMHLAEDLQVLVKSQRRINQTVGLVR